MISELSIQDTLMLALIVTAMDMSISIHDQLPIPTSP